MKKLVLAGLFVSILGAIGLFLFAWSGIYSVAASKGHFAVTRWFLEFGMRNSVELHSAKSDTPDLSARALFERGAKHFQAGCAPCHGAPGFPPSPVAQQMLPAPPDLSKAAPTWTSNELFWIVKNGLKYTGMPAWPASTRDDEVWAMVAFLVQLKGMTPEAYRRVALFSGANASNSAQSMAFAGLIEGDPIACARCHGPSGEGTLAGGVPRLAGQKVEYLQMTLKDYAVGTRPSGIMGPASVYLSDPEKLKLAQYYSALTPRQTRNKTDPQISSVDPEILQLGGAIAAVGIPSRSIPACEACHGPRGSAEGKNPQYPALAGQHFAYLEQQLRLWRSGRRGGTYDEIMAVAVRNITDEQVRAVSHYYANLGNE